MSGLEERFPRVGAKRTLARWNQELQRIRSPILRYGLSVVCVPIALGLALTFQYYQFRDVALPVLNLAVAIAARYAGVGPSVLTIPPSTICFSFFFAEPIHSFAVSTKDLPYFLTFLAWGVLVAWFSTVSRLPRLARDRLQIEVEHRAQHKDEIRRLNHELAKRSADLEATKGLGIGRLFGLARPARAGSPSGRVLGAATKRGVFFARRHESSVHANDSTVSKKNG
jgi:K+-sensing histidine kinase KdpD